MFHKKSYFGSNADSSQNVFRHGVMVNVGTQAVYVDLEILKLLEV